jgi:hypothetical protein
MNFTLPHWLVSALDLHLEVPRWTHNSYRPLTVLTFRWDHWWHGISPAGYRITSIALHAGKYLKMQCTEQSLCFNLNFAVLYLSKPGPTHSIRPHKYKSRLAVEA